MSHTDAYAGSEQSPSPKGSAQDFNITNMELTERKDDFETSSYRSSMVHLTCGLYAMLLIVLGLVFSIAYVISSSMSIVLFPQVFRMYLCVVSIMFLVYLHAYLFRFRDKSHASLRPRSSMDHHLDQSPSNTLNHSELRHSSLTRDQDKKSREIDTFSDLTIKDAAPVHYGGKGINFYLRFGAIVFGCGAMIQNAMQIVSSFSLEDMTFTCSGLVNVIVAGCQFIFTFFQTFFIFKSHKVVINKHKAFVRLGLMHLFATNICRWCAVVVYETAEDVNTYDYLSQGNKTQASDKDNSDVAINCYTGQSLAFKASPYLYPCVVQYSIIAAAMIYNVYRSVGDKEVSEGKTALSGINNMDINIDCHKANKGLFLGLFIVLLTLISICIFMLMRKDLTYTANLVLFITELALLLLSAIIVIAAFARLHRLRFADASDELNTILLLIALSGVYLYNGFTTVSSFMDLLTGKWSVTFLAVSASVLSFVQATLQVCFVLDGARRCAVTEDDVMKKPGRALVTFLLLCNISLCLVTIFDVKKMETVPHQIQFYGYLPWSIISHISIPLIIFFRFHSSVCLSDIWLKAYKRDGCLSVE